MFMFSVSDKSEFHFYDLISNLYHSAHLCFFASDSSLDMGDIGTNRLIGFHRIQSADHITVDLCILSLPNSFSH
jgi:hypothetical protein